MQVPLIAVLGTLMFAYPAAFGQVQTEKSINEPCAKVKVISPTPIKFTESEKSLLCGNKNNPGWEDIPLSQARYFIIKFLESRGYWNHSVVIERTQIVAETNQKVHLESTRVSQSPIEFRTGRYWYPFGKPMTPALLDEMELWAEERLANNGYPCAKVTGQAVIETGEVDLQINPGKYAQITEIKSKGIPGILGGVERRYDAFDVGDEYSAKKFRLTSSRLITKDLVVSSNFIPKCNKHGQLESIEQTLLPGAPRMFSFGVGLDTEEYAIVNVMWKNGRLFETGSPLKAQTWASFRRQTARVDWNWYYLPFPYRHYLDLNATVSRVNERRFDERSVKIGAHPAWHDDISFFNYLISSGPSYQLISTPRGLSKELIRLITWESNLSLATHNFEYYQTSPRKGHQLDIAHTTSDVDLGSNVSASMWSFDTTHLWNVASWSPPIFILGLRSAFSTTTPGEETKPEDLPPTFRHRLGGANNLRGFGRLSLPNNDLGALSTGYVGSEFRLNNVMPFKLQPFLFVDYGWLGDQPWQLDLKTRYWSPGFGTRWESPFGSMRFNLAHGFIEGEQSERLDHLSRWQFYFSFGEQF